MTSVKNAHVARVTSTSAPSVVSRLTARAPTFPDYYGHVFIDRIETRDRLQLFPFSEWTETVKFKDSFGVKILVIRGRPRKPWMDCVG